jgi:hypothetical protein
MIQNGEPLLIDFDTFCVGHPIFELGSMYNAFLGFSALDHNVIKEFMGYDRDTAKRFWKMSLKKYLGTEDEDVCRSVEEKAMIIGYTRLLRRAVRRPDEAESPAMIAHCKKMLAELLEKTDSLCF